MMIARAFGPTGAKVAVIGQGTWRMGESRGAEHEEVAALRVGIELGMTHIDTAEMYADGGAERVIAKAIRGRRDEVFVATKVLPSNASYAGTIEACERSLRRLGTDHVDLYLLHWWSGRYPIVDTMRAMRDLVRRGLTRFVGVSNFGVDQMKQAQTVLEAVPLACNQVLYHLRARAIEGDVLPWCERHRVAVVSYTPLARGGYMQGGPGRSCSTSSRAGKRCSRFPRPVAPSTCVRTRARSTSR